MSEGCRINKWPTNMGRPHQKMTSPMGLVCLALAVLLALFAIAPLDQQAAQAQDLLRRTSANNNNNNNQNQNNANLNPLANFQLPPQLASLTPQQLHQLAQLRELQLQQEARQRDEATAVAASRDQQPGAPAPLGLEAVVLPTAQPVTSQSSGQIPQPGRGDSAAETTPTNNERHDDGSYNESGSEMEGVAMSAGSSTSTSSASGGQPGQASNANSDAASNTVASSAPSFEVNWNKCPQLEPSEQEKNKKTQVITKCLQAAPIPTNLTRENVEAHREQIATCALKVEGWFDESGAYKYDKAETEIRGKHLDQAIESQVIKFHVACKEEASKKFPRDQNKLIDQVQFYQACMDYYISIVCEIEVSVDQ